MRNDNRGQVLIIVALAFVVLLVFAALAVDVAYIYTVRSELQRCADAGALAGASAFVDDTAPRPPYLDLDTDAAARARDFATRDSVAGSPLNRATEVVVCVEAVVDNACLNPLPDNQVLVVTKRTVNLFFARIIGRDSTLVQAVAAANHWPADNTLRLVE
jgi:Flp pilus assembly protein TadG